MNYNRIVLVGRLTRDPEARVTPNGVPVTTFGLAVNRPRSADRQEEVDYFNIVTWRSTAEYVANYLTKGRLVLVEGRLQIRDYTNREGQPAKAVEIVADSVQNMEKRQDSDQVGEESGEYNAPASAPARGGYERGGYERNERPSAAPSAPPPASAGRGQQSRGGARSAPPQSDSFDDYDPFEGE
jgi:single-strand DNA-binding protein